MSFQGDVGGIGLADLLQSLARGREGVLSLVSKGGLRSTLGIQDGLLHLLPDPDEDPEIWRARVRQAWVKDPDFRIDSLRMVEIARAHRTEALYRLLDSEGVHFRFAPGPLPEKPNGPAMSAAEPGTEVKSGRRDAVYLGGVSVEGFLLEYARLKDEMQSAAITWPDFEDAVVILLDPSGPPKELTRFYEQCDGESNLAEIADRMGWPLRQIFLAANGELQRGAARLATPHELLAMAQQEIAVGFAERGAARLRGWHRYSPGGALPELDAQVFQTEWDAGRLQPALRLMSLSAARAFLRRLDMSIGVPLVALDHWTELARVRPDDRIAHVRLVHLQTIASADPNVPAVRDLLAMARSFLENERRLAAASFLRIAADRAPESTSIRLEIGTGFLQCGLPREAGPWIIDAAATMLEKNDSEKALPPLRALVEVEPGNREARRLLSRARTQNVQRTLVKKNSLVTMAIVLAVSIGAVVQFRSQRTLDARIDLVTSHMDDPGQALRILETEFAGDDSSRIRDLRATLTEKKKVADNERRQAWTDAYRDAQGECTLGDPVLGLRRALVLPAPPALDNDKEKLPLVSDLFNGLSARIGTQIDDLGKTIEDTQAQINSESRVKTLIDELKAELTSYTGKTDTSELKKRLDAFAGRIGERDQERASARAVKQHRDNLARQDMLIGAARAHASAGDYKRALELYKELVDADTTHKLDGLLQKEIEAVRAKFDAVTRAGELARSGRQLEARNLLVSVLKKDADARLLPWRVDSFPKGARVHLPDGSQRVTPFVLETTWAEATELEFEHDGHDSVRVSVPHPADQFVWLSRVPERTWTRGGRIEAMPLRVGDDHVVCDRNGHVARISRDSRVVWSRDLQSLGGVSRTPVFLPRVVGTALVVTEDGEVYLLDTREGALEGPYSKGSPPSAGPILSDAGARVRFRDGTILEWSTQLEPTRADDIGTGVARDPLALDTEAPTPNLSVLRQRTGSGKTLESPWTNYEVVVSDQAYIVRQRGSDEPVLTAAREGEWSYVAFEAPTAATPHGRLWVSDGRGLRSFLP